MPGRVGLRPLQTLPPSTRNGPQPAGSRWPKERPGYPQAACTALLVEPSANLAHCPMGSKLAMGPTETHRCPRCPSRRSPSGAGHASAEPHHMPTRGSLCHGGLSQRTTGITSDTVAVGSREAVGSHSEGALTPAAKDTPNSHLANVVGTPAQGWWARAAELAREGGTVHCLLINPFGLQKPKRVQACPAGCTAALKPSVTMSGVERGSRDVLRTSGQRSWDSEL